jgi:branched-chain amino acid transport system permease protein
VTDFFTYLVQGVSQGAIYALVALGFVIIFRGTKVLNFAQGAFMLTGAYLEYNFTVTWGLNYWVALVLAALTMAFVGFALEALVLSRLRSRPTFTIIMATLGLSIAAEQIGISIWGTDPLSLNDPMGLSFRKIGGVTVTLIDVVTLVITATIVGALLTFFAKSRMGTAMRATALDQEAAIAQGVNPKLVFGLSWAIAAAIATVGGVLLSSGNGRNVAPTLIAYSFTAVPAAILGGLDSTKGALFGGLIVGVAQQLMFGYQGRFNEWLHKTIDITIGSFHYQAGLGPNFHLVFPYLIMIVILLVRPYGLFGSREVRRV